MQIVMLSCGFSDFQIVGTLCTPKGYQHDYLTPKMAFFLKRFSQLSYFSSTFAQNFRSAYVATLKIITIYHNNNYEFTEFYNQQPGGCHDPSRT